ncbi:protein bps1 [Quercus suber]|uniref:Protein bps1 n=1 Tax=Quercus suber TaxID=58331 RepID=A0AAW0KD50_QUESU
MHGDSILVQRTLELKTVPPILNKLVESLDLPKVKNSAKWKVLMRVMYGVKVETLFISSVFASAFSGSARKFFDLNVDDKYTWAQALTDGVDPIEVEAFQNSVSDLARRVEGLS